ncbi:MAG: glycosyltransferase family 4 protein [Porticoccaceae bacterium]|nr:glycosyltransferase family 4 protein [Porticoccaceae bacterium]
MNKIRYIAVHPLNDFSGSPRVLADFCASAEIQAQSLTIVTSASDGFLNEGLGEIKTIWYGISSYQVLNVLAFIFAQIQLFVLVIVLVLRSRRRGEQVVVINNTILCFASILASRWMGALTIAYLHELANGHSLEQKLTRKMAEWVIENTAQEVIFVSRFLSEQYPLKNNRRIVIPNGLRSDFLGQVELDYSAKFKQKKVLFVGSLRAYKGVNELFKIARRLPEVAFEAIFNCTHENLSRFKAKSEVPDNLYLNARDPDIQKKYCDAFLVLSLSLPDLCVEGFALTILEGMSAGCPCIVPPVGGHLDYFDDSAGIQLDARNTDGIVQFISELQLDEARWSAYADRAVDIANDYSAVAYQKRVNHYLRALEMHYFD